MTDTDNLMQPGNTHWTDEAACAGDPRFIDPRKTEGLSDICASCPVFQDCDSWAKGKFGMFAAGRWRTEPPVEDIEPWHGKATGGLT